MGLSQMQLNDYNKAAESFKYIIDRKPNLYTEGAEWYLGLCYLKMKDLDNAVKQFDLVSRNQYSIYREKAAEILKAIKK